MPNLRYSEADPGVTDGYLQLLYSMLDTCLLHRELLVQLCRDRVTYLCSILPSFRSGFRTLLRTLALQGSKRQHIRSSFQSLLSRTSYVESHTRSCSLLRSRYDPLSKIAEDVSHKMMVQGLAFEPFLDVSLAQLFA
jgi:hypothetical protein